MRIRVEPAASAAARSSIPSSLWSFANTTTNMLLAVATPMHMIAPNREGTLNVVCVTNNIQRMPAKAPGKISPVPSGC